MNLVIAETFSDALTHLDKTAQDRVKQAVFDFSMDPSVPGFQLHRVEKSKDHDFWSFRVGQDIRVIIHRRDSQSLLCYVDHHDAAYDWARTRVIRQHDSTGVIQCVRIVESEEKQLVLRRVEVSPPLFPVERYTDDYLLALGVPREWLDSVRLATEDNLARLIDHLPEEACERLLQLVDGESVPLPTGAVDRIGFEHPDTGRQFRVIDGQQELRQALIHPWEKWIVFLHPRQRRVVEADFAGPALANGAAGTGKSVVAVHRAVSLARQNPKARILLTTYSTTLADDLRDKVRTLAGANSKEARQIQITNLHKITREQYGQRVADVAIADGRDYRSAIEAELKRRSSGALPGFEAIAIGAAEANPTRSASFMLTEFDVVIDAWGLTTWEQYRDAKRAGRGTALTAKQRQVVWDVIEAARAEVGQRIEAEQGKGGRTWNEMNWELVRELENSGEKLFDHIVVDEGQDFGPAELRFARVLVGNGPNDLFLAGDIGQRIYKQPFSWQAVGIDVRGRSTKLSMNYRTTRQIREFADAIMPERVAGMGDDDSRKSVSLLAGPDPEVLSFKSPDKESQGVAEILKRLVSEDGIDPRSIAILLRAIRPGGARAFADRAVESAGLNPWSLASQKRPQTRDVCIGTMHRAKGLEFEVVIVMGCTANVLPWKKLLKTFEDPADRDAFLEHERNLLYVACTRARRRLFVTHSGTPSPFLKNV